ncbi:MAG: NifB/NifX family molybdenum-iron cluster-binding protein [Candidatus Spyradocola sp.]|jgi:predicted Fe-Mo cluster-binding NifX family protein
MKLAVTYENGEVFQHFGHTEQFKVYDIEDGRVVGSEVRSAQGSGHGALAGLLKSWGVTALICGGIGGGARMALMEAGIELYGGVQGSADAAVEALLTGKLEFHPEATCNHHHEGGEHSCHSGAHACHHEGGEHHCHHSEN